MGIESTISIGKLELSLRTADERDIGFCYELMSHNMKDLFDRNTEEKWSRARFKSGFKQSRIIIVEHKEMSIGFYDYEIINDKLYLHNIQLSEDYRIGIGTQIMDLLEQKARKCNIKNVIAKVFSERLKVIEWLQKQGYIIDKKIEQENSYWIKKDLGGDQ